MHYFKWLLLCFIPYAMSTEQLAIVVDAGSSGSRAYLYAYTQDAPHALPTALRVLSSAHASPPLSTTTETTLPTYLETLFTPLLTELTQLGFSNAAAAKIPVYFYATAGMRAVSPATQANTYHTIQDWITNPQHTPFQTVDARTITGYEEALGDWFSVNYANGSLRANLPTQAIVDVGGASVEIAYETPHAAPNTSTLTIGNVTHYIAAFTWSGVGQDQARDQYLDHTSCFPQGYSMPNGGTGTGLLRQCYQTLKPFFGLLQIHPIRLSPKPISQDIHLLSGAYYTATEIQYAGQTAPASYVFNPKSFAQQANTFCATQWSVLTNQPPYNEDPYAYSLCFAAAHTLGLLDYVYTIPGPHDHLFVTHKIGDLTISHASGIVVQRALGL